MGRGSDWEPGETFVQSTFFLTEPKDANYFIHAGPSKRSAADGSHAEEIQGYGTVVAMPIGLDEDTRRESVENLNQVLADTITLRDLYKKHHWQVSGPTFYQLHLLFDKHFGEQSELVDQIAERIMMLGGISVAMSADVAEATKIPRPPKGREEVPVQISRLLERESCWSKPARWPKMRPRKATTARTTCWSAT